MKVEVVQSKIIDVELSDSTIKEIVIEKFCQVFNIQHDFYLKDGNVVYDHEYHTSHSWFETKIVRKASDENIKAIECLQKLKEEL